MYNTAQLTNLSSSHTSTGKTVKNKSLAEYYVQKSHSN
jgi:hypothetical protein